MQTKKEAREEASCRYFLLRKAGYGTAKDTVEELYYEQLPEVVRETFSFRRVNLVESRIPPKVETTTGWQWDIRKRIVSLIIGCEQDYPAGLIYLKTAKNGSVYIPIM